MFRPRVASARRGVASLLATAVVAAAALVGIAAPVQAAEAEVSGATLDWGVRESFRTYVITMVTDDGAITARGNASQPGGGANPFSWQAGSGSYDPETGAVDVAYAGGVHFVKHDGQLDVDFSNPRIVLPGDGTGTLYLDVKTAAFGANPAIDAAGVPFATLTAPAPATDAGVATWTNVSAVLTAEGAAAFAGFYAEGAALDTLSLTLPYTVPATATTTTLDATPTAVVEGEDVTLTAHVSPTADGAVEFFDGESSLGTSAPGEPLTVNTLPAGSRTLTAVFSPADPAAYTGSASAPVTVVVTELDAPAEATSTVLGVSPESRSLSGEEVTLTASVANEAGDAVAAGTVEFFRIAAGSAARVSLGTSPLEDGTATLRTDTLPAGGHSFVAVFAPEGEAFAASESPATGNHGVVDPSAPEPYMPGEGAIESDESASASWSWSAYADEWTKVASGGITVEDGAFRLSGGVVTADDGGAVARFEGTMRVEAYASFFPPNGQWVELVDPALHVTAAGDGVWVAGVRTGAGAYDGSAAAGRVVVGTFAGVDNVGAGTEGERTVAFDYERATAQGTWHADHADTWPNGFVLKVPSAIQAFYYDSGARGDANKRPADLTVDFAWPEEASGPEPVSGATLEWGVKESFRSYIAGPIAHGQIATSGVASTEAGEFVWSNGTGAYDAGNARGEVSYPGSVRFTGHDGLLDVTLAGPRIAVTGTTTATLYLDVTSKGYGSAPSVDERGVAFADLTLGTAMTGSEAITWTDAAARLTADGAAAFAGFYAAGVELDPVTFTLPLTDSAPTAPTVGLSAGSVEQGGTLVADVTGLEPSERVSAVVNSDPVALGTFTADASGAVTIRWTVPVDFETGRHSLVITRADGTVLAPAYFTVTAASTGSGSGGSGGGGTGDVPQPEDRCVARGVSGGSFSWGVKESFRSYITGPIAKGQINPASGVLELSNGSGAYSIENDRGRVSYSGSIHYTGHGGLLDVRLSDPRIQVNGGSATLIVDVRSAGYGNHDDVDAAGVAFATLSLPAPSESAEQLSWNGAAATLTAAGAEAFMGFYEAGVALDPVSFAFPLGAEVECDGTTDGSLAATGGAASIDALWIGLGLLVLGAGAVVWRRRAESLA